MTYYKKDSAGMVVVDGDPNSWKDSIGNTFWDIARQTNLEKKKEAYEPLLRCYAVVDGKLLTWRHPDHPDDETMSRDHFLYLVLSMKEVEDEYSLALVNKYMTWEISDRHTHSPDSYLFCKGITGSKWAMWLWFRVARISQWVSAKHNARIYKKAGFSPEYDVDTYTACHKLPVTEEQKELRKKLYPIYALENFAFQLRVAPDGKQKKILQRICRRMTPQHNYLLQLLFGEHVLPSKVTYYQSCTNDRWGVVLNETNDRYTRKLTEEEKGDFDLEYLILQAIYHERKNITL